MVTKRISVIAVLFVLFSTLLMAQDSAQAKREMSAEQLSKLIKEFSCSAKMDGALFNFVLLNDKTVDALFQGEGKYAMRARANSATIFLVQGVPEKDITLDPRFEVVQDGKTFEGQAVNMSNLQAGKVAKGTRITGLFQLNEKIDVTHPFKIKGAQIASADFKLSKEAIELLTK